MKNEGAVRVMVILYLAVYKTQGGTLDGNPSFFQILANCRLFGILARIVLPSGELPEYDVPVSMVYASRFSDADNPLWRFLYQDRRPISDLRHGYPP